ncbi:MAG TPA: carboxypeptidase regulatory-like domain-containing protein [Candidatus Bathyarchaeia archaeon]|nr:carboxypeptidase regulatory-like domain-containing protein [Candidatus Bathyarchaeia archaeon]
MQTGFQSLRSGGRCVIYIGRSLLILFLALVLPELHYTSLLAVQSAPALQSQKSDAKIEGRVCNASGEAIAEASVWLVNDMQETVADAETGGDGRFILTVPQPGAFVLEVKRDGFRPVRMELTDPNAPSNQGLNVVMEKLQTAAGGTGKTMEYSDQPNFTIAGVTDWSAAGVHSSTVNARTSEALAKDTAALKSSLAGSGADAANEAEAHRLLGDEKEKSGDPVGAVNEYLTAVKLEPSEENYFAWGAELLLHRASVAAAEVFQKGAAAYPKSWRMQAGLGAAHFADGQYAEAAERMCEASDLDPQEAAPYLFLGKMEKATADLPACSAERLQRFASAQPGNALANEYFGLALWKKGRGEQSQAEIREAEGYFRKAATIDASLGEVYVELGMLYKARGETVTALRAFQKAVKVSPESSDAHYQLSLAYRRAGDAARAKREMDTCQVLRRSEDAEFDKERRELRQFVTVLKGGECAAPN